MPPRCNAAASRRTAADRLGMARTSAVMVTRKVGRVRVPETRPKMRIPAGNMVILWNISNIVKYFIYTYNTCEIEYSIDFYEFVIF